MRQAALQPVIPNFPTAPTAKKYLPQYLLQQTKTLAWLDWLQERCGRQYCQRKRSTYLAFGAWRYCIQCNNWWESVGTHAAGFGTDTQYWANVNNKYTVQGGGAKNAADKMFIQQGAGTTTITNFLLIMLPNCTSLVEIALPI
uniref:pectate lyase n=1 Tax=Ditylenchus dipsaci TaxID=166011 RepID=A0A915DT65_9BILA